MYINGRFIYWKRDINFIKKKIEIIERRLNIAANFMAGCITTDMIIMERLPLPVTKINAS